MESSKISSFPKLSYPLVADPRVGELLNDELSEGAAYKDKVFSSVKEFVGAPMLWS